MTSQEQDTGLTNLLDALSALDYDKYTSFHILSTTYRFSGPLALNVDILIPRSLLAQPQTSTRAVPVMLRIHGGFLVTGSSLYPPWFNDWILAYALEHNAIVISPDYRLLPEVNGTDILDDIHTLWDWVQTGNVDRLLQQHEIRLKLDLTKTLLVGESAGGYLATQLALTHDRYINALVALYPMLDLNTPFYTASYPKPIVGVSNRSPELIDSHIASFTPGQWQSHANSPERLELALSIVQNGRFLEFFGSDTSLFPMDRLNDAVDADGKGNGRNLPVTFLFHGKQDTAVPVEGSEHFVRKVKEQRSEWRLGFCVRDGEHGFDAGARLEDEWLRAGLEPVTEAWLRRRS